MYTILIQKSFGMDRDSLMGKLGERGIETRPAFYPMHLQPLYGGKTDDNRYPVSTRLSDQGINLPSGNGLSKSQIERVASAVLEIGKGC